MIKCSSCKAEFEPRKWNGIIVSKLCPTCLSELHNRKQKAIISRVKKGKPVSTMRSNDLADKSLPELLKKATEVFNKFIRMRDELPGGTFYCPTCRSTKVIEGGNFHACHVFPAGSYPALRFDPRNVWGGCSACNKFKHGVGHEYNDWLRSKLGDEGYEELVQLKDHWKVNKWKWDRFDVIDIIKTYEQKIKDMKVKTPD